MVILAVPPLLTEDGLLQEVPEVPVAVLAATAALTKKFASSICRREKWQNYKIELVPDNFSYFDNSFHPC